MVRNICKSPTFYERGMGVPQFTIGFPDQYGLIWEPTYSSYSQSHILGCLGMFTKLWDDNMTIWYGSNNRHCNSRVYQNTLGKLWGGSGGRQVDIYQSCGYTTLNNDIKKYEQQWRPQRYLRTHTHALRLQCIQMMLESIESIARMDQSCGSVHQNPCFKTNGFAIESGPFSRLGLNFPDGFFCDPAAHRSCRRHSVFWAFCLPASMEDDAMDDWSQLWSCLLFLHGGCPTWFVWLDFTVNWGNTWKHPKKEHKGKSLK